MQTGIVQKRVIEAIERAGARAVDMEAVTDLVACPAVVAVVDPGLLGPNDWNDLRELYAELDEAAIDLAFIRPLKETGGLPRHRLVAWPGLFDHKRLIAFLRNRCWRSHRRRVD